jgi:hypothetical protein
MNIKYLKKKSTIKKVTITTKSREFQATIRCSKTHQYAETCICSSHGHSSPSLYNKYSMPKENAWFGKWKSLWSQEILQVGLWFCLLLIIVLLISSREPPTGHTFSYNYRSVREGESVKCELWGSGLGARRRTVGV